MAGRLYTKQSSAIEKIELNKVENLVRETLLHILVSFKGLRLYNPGGAFNIGPRLVDYQL